MSKANSMPVKEGTKLKIVQIKGNSGNTKRTIETLRSLGLGRVGKTREISANQPLWGMLRKVNHMIEVSEVK